MGAPRRPLLPQRDDLSVELVPFFLSSLSLDVFVLHRVYGGNPHLHIRKLVDAFCLCHLSVFALKLSESVAVQAERCFRDAGKLNRFFGIGVRPRCLDCGPLACVLPVAID